MKTNTRIGAQEGSASTFYQTSDGHSLARPYRERKEFTLLQELKRVFGGLAKLFVAIRYQFFSRHQQFKRFQQKTSVRLAVLAIAVMVVFRNEWKVSLGLPVSGNETSVGAPAGEKMSIAQPVTLHAAHSHFKSATGRQLEEVKVQAYIKRFGKIARLEAQRFGIPASILMARALSESWAGEHPAAIQSNNHFGSPFAEQSFASAWENWRAHSLLMAKKHPEMLRYSTDYARWAKALQQGGYSTQKRYAKTLVGIIEKFHLYTLDQ